MMRYATTLDKHLRTRVDTRHQVRARVDARQTRPRLASVAVPLAVAASLIAAQWWALLPLGVCAWWWSPHRLGWEWLNAIGRAAIGTEWAYMGASALGAFPDDRLVIGVAWAGLPGAVAVYAACVKRSRT